MDKDLYYFVLNQKLVQMTVLPVHVSMVYVWMGPVPTHVHAHQVLKALTAMSMQVSVLLILLMQKNWEGS